MPELNRVIERVRKFLAMSHSDNENEATLAAQRAADMIEEYNLTEAQLRAEDESRSAEDIKACVLLDDTPRDGKRRKRVAWKEYIADGVAKSLGCHFYITANGPAAFGREGATQAWKYTCQYLINEVNRLADEAWEEEAPYALEVGHTPKKWKNSFRVGCGQSIIMRLYEIAENKKRPKTESNQQALMIIEKDEMEVEAAYHKMTEGFGRATMIGLISNRTGYKAGLDAGQDVELGGGRVPLPEGQRSLK